MEELTWGQRRSLPLFFAHYLDGDNLDFEAFNLDPITILMTSIINPLELGSHEHVLALALQSLNHPYLRQAQIPGDSRPSYVDKRELFRCTLFPLPLQTLKRLTSQSYRDIREA